MPGPFYNISEAEEHCLYCQPGYGNLIKIKGNSYGVC